MTKPAEYGNRPDRPEILRTGRSLEPPRQALPFFMGGAALWVVASIIGWLMLMDPESRNTTGATLMTLLGIAGIVLLLVAGYRMARNSDDAAYAAYLQIPNLEERRKVDARKKWNSLASDVPDSPKPTSAARRQEELWRNL